MTYGVIRGLSETSLTVLALMANNNVDSMDAILIKELSKDGRVSLVKLSELTGLSYTSIRNRIQRLIDKGLLEIKPLVSIKLSGSVAAYVRFSVENPEKLLELLSKCNRVLGIMKNNSHDVIAMVYAKNKMEIIFFVERMKQLYNDGLVAYEIEYGELPKDLKIPVKNPDASCLDCIWRQLQLCSGCLPVLRLKKRNSRK